MDTKLLEYFTHVASNNSISLAASELHISQPHLSNSIKRLEQELGAPLFNRVGKHLTLTEYGQYFLPVARDIVTLINTNTLSAGGAGSFNVMLRSHSERLLNLIDSFKESNPDINIAVHLDPSAAAKYPPSLHDFITAKASSPPGDNYQGIRFDPIKFYAAFPIGHPLSQLEEVTIKQLQNEDFIFVRGADNHYEQAYVLCTDEGITPHCKLTTNCDLLKLHYVRMGLGIAVISEVFRETYSAGGDIKVVPITGLKSTSDVMLYVSNSVAINPSATKFLKFVKSSIK